MIRGFSFKYVEGEGYAIYANQDIGDEVQIFGDRNICTTIDTGFMHNNSPSKDKGPTRLNKYQMHSYLKLLTGHEAALMQYSCASRAKEMKPPTEGLLLSQDKDDEFIKL